MKSEKLLVILIISEREESGLPPEHQLERKTFDEVFRLRLSTYGAQERYEKSEKVLRDYNRALVLKHPRKLKSEKLLVILIISEREESGYAAWKVIFLPNNLPLFADKGMLSDDKLGLFHPAQ